MLNHPRIYAASQPAPFLFYNAKSAFLRERGLVRRYPLGHLLGETDYNSGNLVQFLRNFQIDQEFLNQLATDMKEYKGHWTKEILNLWHLIHPEKFLAVYKQIVTLSFQLQSATKEVDCMGAKEIICEEFIPFFLSEGVKVFCVLRDPRDMVVSTNSGTDMGLIRPTLFYLRQWRKSVAYCLEYSNDPNFFYTTYENLVRNTRDELRKIARFLSVKEYDNDFHSEPLRDHQGKPWKSNSSFQSQTSISREGISRYSSALDENAIRFIEAYCYPEMVRLGYPVQTIERSSYSPGLLDDLAEPFEIRRADFVPDYSVRSENLELEKLRILYLLKRKRLSDSEIKRVFIFPQAFRALQV